MRAARDLRTKPSSVTLEAYWKLRNPRFQYAKHIALIIAWLESLEPGDVGILNMPPRSSKTETLMTFLEHSLGRDPTLEVMYTSYSASLANQKSRVMRNNIKNGPAFADAFPKTKLTRDATKVSEWRLEKGGGLIASGVGGSLTGKGAKLAVVDDPLKGRKAAESKVIRDGTIDWLKADVFTRLEPDGVLILTQTRWHKEDPSGWIDSLANDEDNPLEGMRIKKLVIAAIADGEQDDPLGREIGESFWEERWSVAKLNRNKRVLGPYDFASLYQQQPYIRGGTVFKDSPARYTLEIDPVSNKPRVPTGWRIRITGDLGASEADTADNSVLAAWAHTGKLETHRARVLEVIKGHWGLDEILSRLRAFQKRWGLTIPLEVVRSQIQTIRYLEQNGIKIKRINRSAQGDKFNRAQLVAAAWNDDRVEVPISAHWDVADFILEHARFTGIDNGTRDDQVDTSSDQWLEDENAPNTNTPGSGSSRASTTPGSTRR